MPAEKYMMGFPNWYHLSDTPKKRTEANRSLNERIARNNRKQKNMPTGPEIMASDRLFNKHGRLTVQIRDDLKELGKGNLYRGFKDHIRWMEENNLGFDYTKRKNTRKKSRTFKSRR
tara:strand:- start:676 stop:1026 length:351 start_codon:yes stop_codon:yes gene_type:complete